MNTVKKVLEDIFVGFIRSINGIDALHPPKRAQQCRLIDTTVIKYEPKNKKRN